MDARMTSAAKRSEHSRRSSRWAAVMNYQIVGSTTHQAHAITSENGFALAAK
jgi:hypothetical protein